MHTLKIQVRINNSLKRYKTCKYILTQPKFYWAEIYVQSQKRILKVSDEVRMLISENLIT